MSFGNSSMITRVLHHGQRNSPLCLNKHIKSVESARNPCQRCSLSVSDILSLFPPNSPEISHLTMRTERGVRSGPRGFPFQNYTRLVQLDQYVMDRLPCRILIFSSRPAKSHQYDRLLWLLCTINHRWQGLGIVCREGQLAT